MSYDDMNDDADPHANTPEALRIAHDVALDAQAILLRVVTVTDDEPGDVDDLTLCRQALDSAIQLLTAAQTRIADHVRQRTVPAISGGAR